MKKFKLFIIALALTGCAGYMPNRTGVYRPNAKGEMKPEIEMRSSADPETIRAQKEFLAAQNAVELSRDPKFNNLERFLLAAAALGPEELRAAIRLVNKAGFKVNETGAIEYTKVQQALLEAGFVFDFNRGKWFYPKLDPFKRVELSQSDCEYLYSGGDAAKPIEAAINAIYHRP